MAARALLRVEFVLVFTTKRVDATAGARHCGTDTFR